MRKLVLILSCLLSLIFFYCGNRPKEIENAGFSIVDDLGNKITFGKAPERIISLAPNITEIIYALRCGDKLAGSTLYCYYPEEAKNLEKVGDLLTVNLEKVVSLKPDLVFITVEGNAKEYSDKLRELGVKIFISNPRNYDGIKKTVLDIAEILDKKDLADSLIKNWDNRVNYIKNVLMDKTPKKGAFMVSLSPIMLAGKNTFINSLMETVNIKNIAEDSPMNYPVFSREEILQRNPEYMIVPENTIGDIKEFLKIYPEWKRIDAVKNNKIIWVDPDISTRPGPRFIEAVEFLFQRLYDF